MELITVGSRTIGSGQPPYVIAEVGSNHNGDMDLCRRLIDAAADAGADAVKFQSWSEKTLIADEEYARNTEYADRKKHFGSLRSMVQAYQFTVEQHRLAHAHCLARGIAFCSTPFAPAEVDMLESLDVPFYKVASMDIVYPELLRHIARKGRPVMISTGMATLSEIEEAVAVVRSEGNRQIVLLHCVSIYPPDHDTIHLRNIETLRDAFDVPVGFSDHTMGTAIPMASIALGACVIEKHFTLDKDMPGWDHAISADPKELRSIVEDGKHVWQSLGCRERTVSTAEMEKRKKFRRSLVLRHDVEAGHVLRAEDLNAKRPGTGVPPNDLSYVLGRKLNRAMVADQVLRWSDLAQ